MHRTRQIAREGKRVLLTSFGNTICNNIERNLQALCSREELDQIQVSTVHSVALSMVKQIEPGARPINADEVLDRIDRIRKLSAPELEADFLVREWDQVVQPLSIVDWEGYRDIERRGRGRSLSVRERQRVWEVLGRVRADLEAEERFTWPGLCHRARELVESGRVSTPFDAVIVDEVQDLKPAEIRFLAAVAGKGGGLSNLMLLGDAGQRIYPGGFSLRSLGIDVRGRSRVLRINYRTTEQIRRAADRVLGTTVDDLDGESERRDLTRSLLRGPEPTLRGFSSATDEVAFVADRIQEVLGQGVQPGDVAVFARVLRLFEPVQARFAELKLPSQFLADEGGGPASGVSLGSMHRAKGLEFRVVFVIGCGDGFVPLRAALSRCEGPDLDEAIERERSLLYVSLTRARDEAFVTWHGRPSRFLEPLLGEGDAR
jgi:superfamily I DNA/RNA helicase